MTSSTRLRLSNFRLMDIWIIRQNCKGAIQPVSIGLPIQE